GQQGLVVVGPRLVVVLDRRHGGTGEDGRQVAQPPARPQREPSASVERPSSPPALLVLVRARVALTRPGLDVVPPRVLHAGAVRPGLLARHAAGVAPDALVEIH